MLLSFSIGPGIPACENICLLVNIKYLSNDINRG